VVVTEARGPVVSCPDRRRVARLNRLDRGTDRSDHRLLGAPAPAVPLLLTPAAAL